VCYMKKRRNGERGETESGVLPVTSRMASVKAQGPLRCDLHEVVVTSNDD